MKRLMVSAALSLSACGYENFEWCWIECDLETGGDEDGGLYCGPPRADGTWLCLDAPQHDHRVKAAIDDGVFVPYTDAGTCPHRGREWDALRELDPVVSPVPPVRAVECSDAPLTQATKFSLCFPEIAGWSPEWPDGAVGLAGNDEWSSICSALGPYAFLYDYAYNVPCAHGVTCLGFDDRCSCKCGSDSDCGDMQTYLETWYLGEDEHGLIPGGWESTCTGVPWQWDQFAYENGGYLGTACEWNGEDPGELETPPPMLDVLDGLECVRSTCTIAEYVLDDLLANPGLVAGSSLLGFGLGDVEIIECNHTCAALGLTAGDRITAIGQTRQDPTASASWSKAYDELLNGRTEGRVFSSSRAWTLTLELEN